MTNFHRQDKMLRMFAGGMTLEKIGRVVGSVSDPERPITKERVRQTISRQFRRRLLYLARKDDHFADLYREICRSRKSLRKRILMLYEAEQTHDATT